MDLKEQYATISALVNEIGADIEDRKDVAKQARESSAACFALCSSIANQVNTVLEQAEKLRKPERKDLLNVTAQIRKLLQAQLKLAETASIETRAKAQVLEETVLYLSVRQDKTRQLFEAKLEKAAKEPAGGKVKDHK
jgi:hypothetical protein